MSSEGPSSAQKKWQSSARSINTLLGSVEAVAGRREAVLKRWTDFKAVAAERRAKLEDAKRLQQFNRNADELEAWISGKLASTSDETTDLSNLEVKIKKHQAFKAEVHANENALQAVRAHAQELVGADHFASEAISAKVEALDELWQLLLDKAEAKAESLKASQQLLAFKREADEVDSWIETKAAVAADTDLGRDLEHCDTLIKKCEDFTLDLNASDGRLDSLATHGAGLIEQAHPATDEIQTRLDATNKGWHALKQQAAGRYSALSAAKQAHAFDRDAAEIEARIAEKDRLVSVNDYGQDLVSVEALQRKHEVFARDLAALGDGVAAVSEDGKRLATATPSNGSDIRAKMEQVQDQWTALSTKAQARKTRLDDSYDLQRFFNDLRTSLAWITDMKSLMQAEEVANDVAGAEALLQRHQEHRDEIQARVETFKAVVDFGNALILKGHFATDELEQGLVGLKAARDGLDALHASRQTEFEESLASQLFFRDAEQVEAWMASRENLLASDDVGDSLDSVDALMKKHGDFERNLKAQEDKPRALDENRRKLVQSGHTQAAAITERCDAVLERRAQLLQAAKARRQLLVDARKYEEFKRDADEVEAWMSEKAQTASDPSYKDATNLRGKLKNHEAFQAELTANGTRIAAAVSSGQSLVDSDHFAKVAIQERLVALQQQWDELNAHSSDKAQKLQEAHEQQEFNRRVDDINAWCEETETALASEDNGRDLPHVQKLLKKHQLMEADVTGQRERVDNTLAQGKRMVDAANFQSPAIEAKMAALTDRYAALAAPLAARKQTLDASLQLQQFLRNSEDEESWIREKEPAVASTNYGNSLTAVQNHQKKHNALKAEIAGRNKAVQAVLTTADGLLGQDHFGHATIAGKREGLAAQWEQLNSLSAHRGDVLQEALLVQQYLADANEADAWIGEKEPVVSSDNYGKDEDSALALLKKHEAVEAELRTYQRTIDSLHTDSQKCSALAESRSSAPAATAASAKVKMTVLFDFEADNDRKLSVAKGQVVELISKDSSGWCHVRNDSGKAGFVPANYLKETASRVSPVPALGSGSPVKDGANLSPETITSRQNSLEASYAELLSQAGQRRKRLQETQQLHQLNREMDEVESWMNSREAVASQTELGTDLEHNELLQKKFEDFNKDLNANETRVKSANGLATQLLDAGHSDGAVIAQRRDALNTRWSQLQALALERQAALQAAHEVHQFQRHVDDTVARFGEKDVVLSLNEYGRDVASVEALQRKHDGAIRDLAALEGKVQDLRQEADRLATAQPQAAPDVQGKRQEIDTAWAELQRKAADRKHRLAEALRFQKFLGEHRDLSSWTTGMITLASSDELARDAAGAEALLKRHQDLQTEIDARSDGIAAFRANSQKLLSDDHEKAGDIAAKTQELDRELQQLQDQMGARQQVLEQCHELQAFNRSAEQVEAWIAAREGPLASDDVGTTLDSVEAMLKKHQDFEQSLVPQSDKVREVATEAHRLIQDGHYDADGIESRKRAVQDRWTRLQELADSRKAKLNAALAVQRFHRDADEAEAWITEKAQVAADPSYKDPSNLTGKLQKHQAFEAEVAANEARIFAVVDTGRKVMRENPDGSGSVPPRIASLEEQWALLQESTNDKAQKLQEAGSQQQFNHSVEDIEFWLSEIEVQLSTNDKGRDLPSVQNLIKKHQLIEADIDAHKERMDAIHSQADHFAEQGHFDAPAISQKYQQLEQRYRAVQTMSGQRSGSLTDALKLQQILRDIEDELAWIKEKERLAASTDFGKDLTGVQNLQKKHLAFDAELKGHEGRIFAVVDAATALIKTGHYATDELTHKSQDLEQQWAQLKALSEARRHKLGEAVEFQLLRTGLDEEESWINEKLSAMANDDVPDTLSGAQALVKKHEAFEGDLQEHRTSVDTLATEGQGLVSQGNYQAPEIQSSLSNLRSLLASLQEAADSRKGVLGHRYDFLRLSREADSIEAWIEDKEPQAASADYGKDLAASQALTTKQDTFDASVSAFRPRINAFQTLLADLVSKKNSHIGEAQTREEMVMQRWRNLLAAAEKRRAGLSDSQDMFKRIDNLFLEFAHKASQFNSWFENAEEDLTDPVRVNSLEEIRSLRASHAEFMGSLQAAEDKFKQLSALDQKIASYTEAKNPYTWFTVATLQESWENLLEVIEDRNGDLQAELERQEANEELRKLFAKHANDFSAWLTSTRAALVEGTGTLEEQLAKTKARYEEVLHKKIALKRIEELGARMEENLILDNRYTEHSTVGLAQQWDQLEQLGMRMQHNLEQQIQAKDTTGVSEEQLKEFNDTFRYFDKDGTGKLDHQELKSCLRSLGYSLPVVQEGEADPEFNAILTQLDPSGDGMVSHSEFVSFMIARETENVESASEVISAFRAAGGDKPYVTADDLSRVLTPDQVEYCARRMQPYRDQSGQSVQGAFDYTTFTHSIFVN